MRKTVFFRTRFDYVISFGTTLMSLECCPNGCGRIISAPTDLGNNMHSLCEIKRNDTQVVPYGGLIVCANNFM